MISRKLLISFLIIVLLVTIGHPVEASSNEWAVPAIEKAKEYGFIEEGMASDYRDYITREEFCELSMRVFSALRGEDATVPSGSPFKDTNNPSVIKAYTLGIIKGLNNDLFAPNNHITREQIAVMLYRLIQVINPAIVEGNYLLSFKDEGKISPWAKEAIQCLAAKGIMRGVGQNTFMPNATVTWEQAVALAVRTYELMKSFWPVEKLPSGGYAFKVYKSSTRYCLPEDYLEMKITQSDKRVAVKGKTSLGYKHLKFIISGKGQSFIEEVREIDDSGIYSFEVNIQPLPEGQHLIFIYGYDEERDYYEQVEGEIPILKIEQGVYFPTSPVYSNNVSKYSNAVQSPENYLSLAGYSDEEKEQLKKLAAEITKGKNSDYEKAFAICDWVSNNIYFNYDAYHDRPLRGDAIGVLETKRTTSGGYAELTSALLRSAGIPARIVSGFILPIGRRWIQYWDQFDHRRINHAWNEVFVNGRWIIVDTTLNSGNRYESGQYIYSGRGCSFFDISIEELSYTHKIINRW